MIRPLLFALALAPVSAGGPAAAQQLHFQDTAAIDVAVSAFTGHAIGEEGGARTAVDKRLKLAACPLPQLDWRGSYQDAVVVRCDAPAWRIYVPIHTPPRPAPVAAVAAPVPVAAAKAEPVIRRGDAVTVEVGAAGFSISRDGVAMGDAPAGGRIAIRIDPAKPPVQAVAVEPGRATLPGWAQ
ncbi:flagella basal body P-ring formation protein FlgA [Sphingomonas sp.]|uniref:flagella basal body P-ring formation protein FlgA n=1 Tax=Sphingomonas sp. TaxID=28214 RepID=UPI002C669B39|nr:flagella basal body P-ring formation protein FlgA [Sphingomonas sp.]HWK36789.1 flagella basal body P-ring formation protein FlgA [Sphingomonas sp.]